MSAKPLRSRFTASAIQRLQSPYACRKSALVCGEGDDAEDNTRATGKQSPTAVIDSMARPVLACTTNGTTATT